MDALKASDDQRRALATLSQLIIDAGLEAHAAQIAAAARPSIMLTTRKAVRADLAVAASRLGGEPDLAIGSAWPEVNGAPLPFLAQIRLEDVFAHDAQRLLPPAGLLSFFAKDLDCGHVRFEADVSKLARRPLPEAIEDFDRIFAWGFEVRGEVSIPPAGREGAPDDGRYIDLPFELSEALEHGFSSHQLLGYLEDPDEPRQSPGLELLLAINSDDKAGLNFGDSMRQYFYLDRARLLARDFSAVIVTAGV